MIAFTEEEISAGYDDLLAGKNLDKDLREFVLVHIEAAGFRDKKRFLQFAQLAENDAKLRKVVAKAAGWKYGGTYNFFKQFPNYNFEYHERVKLIKECGPESAIKLLIHKLYRPQEEGLLIDIILHDKYRTSAVKEFFTKYPYTENHKETYYRHIMNTQNYHKAQHAALYISLFPDDSHRQKLFTNYIIPQTITPIMKFAKEVELKDEEKKQIIEKLQQQSGFQILKFRNTLSKLFDDSQELDNFVQENFMKILDWSLTKGATELIKLDIEITQEHIDYIVKRVTQSKGWKVESLKEILDAMDKHKIQVKQEDYDKLLGSLALKALGAI